MRRVDSLHTDEAPEGARVTLITAEGNKIQGYLGQPTGMPGNPLTDERLHAKFLRCAEAGGVEDLRARELLEHLKALEKLRWLSALFGSRTTMRRSNPASGSHVAAGTSCSRGTCSIASRNLRRSP